MQKNVGCVLSIKEGMKNGNGFLLRENKSNSVLKGGCSFKEEKLKTNSKCKKRATKGLWIKKSLKRILIFGQAGEVGEVKMNLFKNEF